MRSDVIARHASFYRSLLSSPCREVTILARLVAKDIRTTTARNLRFLKTESCGHSWTDPLWKVKQGLVSREPAAPS